MSNEVNTRAVAIDYNLDSAEFADISLSVAGDDVQIIFNFPNNKERLGLLIPIDAVLQAMAEEGHG